MGFFDVVSGLVMVAQFAGALAFFIPSFNPRNHIAARIAFVIFLCAVIATMAPFLPETSSFEGQIILMSGLFALLPFAVTAALLFCFDLSFWDGISCSIVVFTMENFANGVDGFLRVALSRSGVDISSILFTAVCTLLVTTMVYVFLYFTFLRHFNFKRLIGTENHSAIAISLVVVLVAVVFDMINKTLPGYGVPIYFVYALRVVHGALCLFILYAAYEIHYNRRLEADAVVLEKLIRDSERQYKMSRENIEAINIKCHDLKHQIRELRQGSAVIDNAALDEIEHAVGIYDAVVKTGNEALDTIITEKSLFCEREHIMLSCIADGTILNGIAPSDLYALFGNILDNAIEAVSQIGDRDRRTIGLTVKESLGMVMIHAENFYAGKVVLKDGLPVTTKRRDDGKLDTLNHGFGTQSIRHVAQNYGGSLKCQAANGVFTLDILLPAAE